jgi:hypothetical protein
MCRADERNRGFGVTQQQPEENAIDVDRLAIEQIEKGEPDELDGPAFDLDRTLDDEDPDNGR